MQRRVPDVTRRTHTRIVCDESSYSRQTAFLRCKHQRRAVTITERVNDGPACHAHHAHVHAQRSEPYRRVPRAIHGLHVRTVFDQSTYNHHWVVLR